MFFLRDIIMGFLDSIGNGIVGVATAGQCDTGGCGGGHRDTAVGDALVNTATLGQCNGSGCGSGHTDTWTPASVVQGGLSAVQSALGGQATPQQQQQILQLIELAGIGLAAFLVLDLIIQII